MRVYNNRQDQLDLPLSGEIRLSIPGKSISDNILGSTEFLTRIISTFKTDEIAFIVCGPYELNMCANIPTCTNYVVQSVAEAVARFSKKEEPEKVSEIKVENEPEVEVEVKEETIEPVVEEQEQPKTAKKKKSKKAE